MLAVPPRLQLATCKPREVHGYPRLELDSKATDRATDIVCGMT